MSPGRVYAYFQDKKKYELLICIIQFVPIHVILGIYKAKAIPVYWLPRN